MSRPERKRLAADREPSRIPGEGRIELEPSAGDLQINPLRVGNPLAAVSRLSDRLKPQQKEPAAEPPGAPHGRLFRPGSVVPASGVYNVVDKHGVYLEHQITCHRGRRFPPAPHEEILKKFPERRDEHELAGPAVEDLYAYELAYKAIHLLPDDEPLEYPPTTYLPGEAVPVSGIYNLVDEDGRYVYHQRALVHDHDSFPPLEDPAARGYALAFPAQRLRH